jgi:hypothetical protein
MQTPATAPAAARTYDKISLVAGTLCAASLVFESLGWLIAAAGVGLLFRAGMRTRTKWLLAALALLPRVLFVGIRLYFAPRGLLFDFEPRTLATSFSLWTWSSLLVAFGVLAISQSRATTAEQFELPQPDAKRWPLLGLGIVCLVVAAIILVEPLDGFQRIEDAGDGQWALKHAARGTRATFAAKDVSLIEGTEQHSTRGSNTYSVRVTLADGRSFSVSARTRQAFQSLREFATTAGLGPGRARIVPYRATTWTNTVPAFTRGDFAGTYDFADKDGRERRTLELAVEGDRIVGKETVTDAASTIVRDLRNLKIDDTGRMTFDFSTHAQARSGPDNNWSFSLRWSSDGTDAHLSNDGIRIGTIKYRRR